MLPYLQTLTLHGNPLSKSMFYRAKIITRLTNLMALDGKNILESDIKICKLTLTKVINIMEILL